MTKVKRVSQFPGSCTRSSHHEGTESGTRRSTILARVVNSPSRCVVLATASTSMRPLLTNAVRIAAPCRCRVDSRHHLRRVAVVRKSSTSSAASTAFLDFAEGPDVNDDKHHCPPSSSVMDTVAPAAMGRPRLQRLRERLQHEKIPAAALVKVSQWARPTRHHATTDRPANTTTPPSRLPSSQPQSHPTLHPPSSPSSFSYEALRDSLRDYPDPTLDRVLVDTFARRHTYLRLSLTERCNLRCTYCMPEQGVPLQPPEHLLQTPELLYLAQTFASFGVTKFRLTGGEPTLRHDVVDVVRGLRQFQPHQIGMTSNGIKIPSLLDDLVDAGLNSLNVSLDTVFPDKFAHLTRRPAKYLDRVWQALDRAHEVAVAAAESTTHSRFSVKLNCVVMRGVNDHEVADFCRLVDRYPLLQVRFIEYMPFDENGWNQNLLVGYQELLSRLESEGVHLRPVPSDDPHDTTKWYDWSGEEGWLSTPSRRIGFITSMSAHFCDSCNRVRLTADGQLKSCLFDGGEVSLTRALREGWDDSELRKLVHYALQTKPKALGGHDSPDAIHRDARRNRPMTLIGG